MHINLYLYLDITCLLERHIITKVSDCGDIVYEAGALQDQAASCFLVLPVLLYKLLLHHNTHFCQIVNMNHHQIKAGCLVPLKDAKLFPPKVLYSQVFVVSTMEKSIYQSRAAGLTRSTLRRSGSGNGAGRV